MLGLGAVAGCSSLLSRVKPLAKGWFQLAPVSWPSCRQQASLFRHGHGIAAFPFLLQILLLFQILGHRCRIFEGVNEGEGGDEGGGRGGGGGGEGGVSIR